MASITFEHVTKVFDGVRAVEDLCLKIADGEFLVLVGPRAAARRPPCGWSRASRR
jgi:multiple sugar transport system ATP-binding protein